MKPGIYAFKLLDRLLKLCLETSLIVEKYCIALTKKPQYHMINSSTINSSKHMFVQEIGVDEKYSQGETVLTFMVLDKMLQILKH